MAIDKKSYRKTALQNIKIHKDGIKFWFDFTLNGKRYSKLWTATKAQSPNDRLKAAGRQLDIIKDEIVHANSIEADIQATIDDYYTITKTINKWSPRTTATYDGVYKKYIYPVLGDMKIKDIQPKHLTKLNISTSHLAKGSAKKLYDILIPIFLQAIEDEIIVRTPVKRVHVPKRDQLSEKKVIAGAEAKYRTIYKAINQLFNSEDTIVYGHGKTYQCSYNPHHLALFLFGFHGRRIGEVTTLKWNDINFDTNQYRIRKGVSKIDTDMIFTLPQDVREALLKFKPDTLTDEDVFIVKHPKKFYFHIRKISRIDEFTFHWMRNLAVSALSSAGVASQDLSGMLGHTDLSTLRKYLSLQREQATSNTNDISVKLLAEGAK